MLKKLRIKFICITMLIVTVMLCIIMGLIIHFTHSSMESQSIQLMRAVVSAPAFPDRPGTPPAQMPLRYCVVSMGRHGELLNVSGNYDLSETEGFNELLRHVLEADDESGVIKEYRLRYLRVPQPKGSAYVFSDMSFEQDMLGSLVRNCILIGLASLAVMLAVSVMLARWAIRPVEKSWEQQRQFVADASHELKTPLTVISTNAELLQSPDCTHSDAQRFSQNIRTMTGQMRSLVEGMLDLARIDNGAVRTMFSPNDLSVLVNDTALHFEAVFFERGLTLECQVEGGISVMGSQSHLRQLIEIFLDNAQKYSESGTTVTVSLRRSGRGHCLLSVASHGESIDPQDLRNIFKRFYRADKARTGEGSYGMGLSIAEGIVHAHRGEIWAESADGENTFFVRLASLVR